MLKETEIHLALKTCNIYAQNAHDIAVNSGLNQAVASKKANEAFQLAEKRLRWGLNVWTGLKDKE